jgi:uncharacterized protein (DUF608 family)
MKIYREWRISGDASWLRRFWPKVRESLDYCIRVWDPRSTGTLEEPHHNTYDIEFWGPDGLCTTFYLGALLAADRIGTALGEDTRTYRELFAKGLKTLESTLFNGEYFQQEIRWRDLDSPDPTEAKALMGSPYSPEAKAILAKEGPKYQYGNGCLADGILGAWIARVCGLDGFLDPEKEKLHLLSIYRYNMRHDLTDHVNPQRPTYAVGKDGGLILCTWPRGAELSLPFPYSNEVWTGFEYQVASHLMFCGHIEEALDIVRTARKRHDGRIRNPFNEYECGHWYARAMSSYGLLQGMTGIRYDAAEKILYLSPRIPGDFEAFLSTATGYGTAGIRSGKPFLDVAGGAIETAEIRVVR